MTLRLVDLFAGGGGLSLGFQNAGFDVVCALDNWQPAIDTYATNIKGHLILKVDLSNEKLATETIKPFQADIIVGGPPCQDFSSAGKRDETLGRASLTISYAKIIAQCKPSFFLMENVARAAESTTFKEALNLFRKAGYGLTIKVMNAAYCGVPQLRKRLIVIGSLNDQDGFLDNSLEAKLSKVPMTVRDYLGKKTPIDHYYRHPRSYARRGVFSSDEPSPTVRGVNRPIPKGYPGHDGDTVPVSDKLRSLTTHERALIQTFPAHFVWPTGKTDAEQVIGNAVPVKFAEYIATCLAKHIQSGNHK